MSRPWGSHRDEPANVADATVGSTAAIGPRDLGRQPALDGLRGVAVLAVLWMHFVFLNGGDRAWSLSGGFLGVDVFLVLSGFLIGSVLLREAHASGTIDGARFFRRRTQRLLPPLVVLLAIHAVVGAAIYKNVREQLLQIVLSLSFTSNWQVNFGHQAPFELVHLWSLALEGQFYALAALIVWSARKRLRRPQATIYCLVAAAVIVGVWRMILFQTGSLAEVLYQRTDTRLDSVLLGLAAALVWRAAVVSDRTIRIFGALGAVFVAASAVFARPDSAWLFNGGFTVIAAATAAMVAAVATGGGLVNWIADLAPLRWVGSISYSLYLWHLPIYIWTVKVLPDAALWQKVGVAIPAAFFAAALSFRLVESRALAPWRGGRMSPDGLATGPRSAS